MATARVPLSEFSSGPITINSSLVPNPQGYFLPAGGTVTFTNTNTSGSISITFVPAGVFNDIPALNAGVSNSQAAQIPIGGVTYFINGNLTAPYAIQVGVGPIPVAITAPGGAVTYTPQFAAIPVGGKLLIYGGDQSYNVIWTGGGDPVTPAITQALQGFSNNVVSTGNKPVNTYNYSATAFMSSQHGEVREFAKGGSATGGGGRIVVKST
jgi:hypothetical protein